MSDIQSPYFESRKFEQVLEHGKNCKERRKIIGAFLYEDTTTLLFSRTNYGKSLLVFQFAYAAATGSSFDPCQALSNECEPMKVLVVDLELDSRVLWERHSAVLNDKNPYLQNLYYLHEKADKRMMIGFELLDKIEQAAIAHEAKLVIIDNISKLLPDALKPDTATMVIAMLNRIRINTGASILVIGHTTKGNPRICIQPTDYYGSSMLQNFFNELSFLDMTKDSNFFLCHSKTKHKECFNQTVPVFSRGEHNRVGVGFTFCNLQNLIDIQLPMMLTSNKSGRSGNLSDFRKEITLLSAGGTTHAQIAKLLGVSRSAVSHFLNNT
jgi:RecA-family ATPase